MTLQQFLNSPRTVNAWVSYKTLEVYVRRSHRVLSGQQVHCLDIANVVNKEKRRGKGDFWSMLVYLFVNTPKEFGALYIENVLNPELVKSLQDIQMPGVPADGQSCFYFMLRVDKLGTSAIINP